LSNAPIIIAKRSSSQYLNVNDVPHTWQKPSTAIGEDRNSVSGDPVHRTASRDNQTNVANAAPVARRQMLQWQ
jgi:hypothetical protein